MRALFRYTLKLTAPAVLTGVGGDPNSASSLNYIPGSALRGAVAACLGAPDSANAEQAARFDALVLSGRVHYLNAYPIDAGASSASGQRAFPRPLSLQKPKYSEDHRDANPVLVIDTSHYDDSGQDEADEEEQLIPLEFPFIAFTGGSVRGVKVDTVARLHHQRDRVKGRPTETRGAIFEYGAIAGGQVFQGFMSIEGDDEDAAAKLAEELAQVVGDTVMIGRSRRSGYGGWAQFRMDMQPVSRELTTSPALRDDLQPGSYFRVLLTSHYIGRDQLTGQIDPASFLPNLECALQSSLTVLTASKRYGVVGGYNRKAGLALPQTTSLVAGSIFTLRAETAIPSERWLAVESAGLGDRRCDGFGRFVFLTPSDSRRGVVVKYDHAREDGPLEYTGPISQDSRHILDLMQRRLLTSELENRVALVTAELTRHTKGTISSSLIGRLRVLLRAAEGKGLREFGEQLKELRPTAVKQLRRFRLNDGSRSEIPLGDWLFNLARQPDSISRILDFGYIAANTCLVSEREARNLLSFKVDELGFKLIDSVLAAISQSVRLGRKAPEDSRATTEEGEVQ